MASPSNPLAGPILIALVLCAGCVTSSEVDAPPAKPGAGATETTPPTTPPTTPGGDVEPSGDFEEPSADAEPAPWKDEYPPFSLARGGVVYPPAQEEGGWRPGLQGSDPEDAPGFIDAGHQWVCETVDQLAFQLDGFFRTELSEGEFEASRIRVRGGYEFASHGRSEPVTRFKLQLRLPGTEKRLRLFVDNFSQQQNEEDDSVADADPDQRDGGLAGGFRYFLRVTDSIQTNIDAGVKFRYPPEPFVKLRARRTFPLSERWLIRPSQWFFWELDEGFGETTRLDVDRRCFETALLRFRQKATYSQTSNGLEFESAVIYYEQVRSDTGYRLSARIRGETKPQSVVTDYGIFAQWRQAIYKDWLILEIEPNIRFPRLHDYEFSPGVAIVFEAVFSSR